MIAFTVIGIPAPQGSKTPWGSEANPNTKPWRATVAVAAFEAQTDIGEPLITCPVSVDAVFIFPRPKSHYGTGRNAHLLRDTAPQWHATKPDADKLARAIGDALTGVLIRDDSLIVDWRIRKIYGSPARCELLIQEAQPIEIEEAVDSAA